MWWWGEGGCTGQVVAAGGGPIGGSDPGSLSWWGVGDHNDCSPVRDVVVGGGVAVDVVGGVDVVDAVDAVADTDPMTHLRAGHDKGVLDVMGARGVMQG